MTDSTFFIWLSGGFLAGLSVGAACVGVCGSVLLPLVLSRPRGIARNLLVLLNFSAGRLLSCVCFGAAVGWLGAELNRLAWFPWVLPTGYLLAALFLLRYVYAQRSCACGTPPSHAARHQLPFILGIATGLNFCPPLVLAIATAVHAGSAVRGMGYFVAFFLGTSIYLLPIPFLGSLTRWPFWVRLGRLAGTVVGFVYVYLALSSFYELMHGPWGAAGPERAGNFVVDVDTYRVVYPGATRFRPMEDSTALFSAYDEDSHLGYIADTRQLPVPARGYAGATPLALAVSKTGEVLSIHVFENRETPEIIEEILQSPWWAQWLNIPVDELVSRARTADAVTGATITCNALRENVHAAAAHVRQCPAFRALAEDEAEARSLSAGQRLIGNWQSWLPVLLLLAAAVLVARAPVLRQPWLRWCVWICSILFLGFYRVNYFSIRSIASVIHGDAPTVGLLAWHLVFFFAVLSPLFLGRVYCRFLCPFGALSEVLYRIVPGELKLPPWFLRAARTIKFVLLIAALVLIVVLPTFPVWNLEPFQAVFAGHQPRVYIIFGVSVLIVSCVVRRFWCRLFCLDGALFEIISRFGWSGRDDASADHALLNSEERKIQQQEDAL